MKIKSTFALILPAMVVLSGSALSATVYNIDIDAAGTIFVKPGYTRLESPFTGSGGSVTIDGDTFTLVGQAGARARNLAGAGNSDGVNRDFAFRESGTGGVEVGMMLGAAGGLEAGTWELSVYSWDSDVPVIGQRAGIYTTTGAVTTEITYATGVDKRSDGPAATFRFNSDGVSAYSLFLRDSLANNAAADADDKVRLNGIDLVFIPVPEPSTFALFGLGGLLLFRRRR